MVRNHICLKGLRKQALALTACTFMNAIAQGTDQWHTSMVKAIYPLADGSYTLTFVDDAQYCTGSSPKYHWVVTTGSNAATPEAYKNFYATALMAFGMGHSLTVVYNDATSNCYIRALYLSN